MTRVAQLVICTLTLFAWVDPGEAAKRKKKPSAKADAACVEAFKRALELEKEEQFIPARKVLYDCAHAKCGALIKRKCNVRYFVVKRATPSVIPTATDENGDRMTDVEVTMDGQLLTPYTDGKAIEVNPGVHEFSFSDEKGIIAKKNVEIAPGQKNLRVAVSKGR
jgi:hypothetical protein